MSNPTTPFSWQMPTSTDLVTDLPADFEVFGQAVATSMADLLGGTTGQVLKKNSNTDMDFVWGTDAAGMTNPMTTTGDTIYSSSGSTPARLGIGTSGQVLTVAAGIPSWATPGGSGSSYSLLNAGGTALSGSTTVTVSGISGIEKIMVIVTGAKTGTAYNSFYFRINGDSGTNYVWAGNEPRYAQSSYNYDPSASINGDALFFAQGDAAGSTASYGAMFIDSGKSTGFKHFSIMGSGEWKAVNIQGIYKGSAAITNVSIISPNSMNAGTIYVYGSAA
jgi:hypothetical protein